MINYNITYQKTIDFDTKLYQAKGGKIKIYHYKHQIYNGGLIYSRTINDLIIGIKVLRRL